MWKGCAGFCRDEGLKRRHTSEKAHEVIFSAESENGIDKIVADASLTLLNFETVGKEIKHILRRLASLNDYAFCFLFRSRHAVQRSHQRLMASSIADGSTHSRDDSHCILQIVRASWWERV